MFFYFLKAIAKEIFNAGESKLGTDESVFNKYFGTLSPHELACIAQFNHKLTRPSILDSIDKEMHGILKKLIELLSMLHFHLVNI